MMQRACFPLRKLLWSIGVALATFATTDATAQQLLSDSDLLVRRSTCRDVSAALTRSGVAPEMCTALYDDYRLQFEHARIANERTIDWTYHQRDLARNTAFNGEMENVLCSVELRWQIGARDANRDFFAHLRSLASSEMSAIDALEYAQLREAIVCASVPLADIAALLHAIDPAAAAQADVAVILDEHAREFDTRLRRKDRRTYLHKASYFPYRTLIQEARVDQTPDLPQKLEPIVQLFARLEEETPLLREATHHTLRQLQPLLIEEQFSQLRAAVERSLYPFMFTGAGAIEPLVRSAMMAADLTDAQREGLVDIQTRFDRAATAAIATLAPLYDRTLSASHWEHLHRAWAYAAVRTPELQELSKSEASAADATDAAFKDALHTWHGSARVFARAIDSVMGRSITPAIDVPIAAATPDDDEGIPATDCESQVAPLFMPFHADAPLQARFSTLPPSTRLAVEALREALAAEYSLARARFDDDMAKSSAEGDAFTKAHPDGNPWLDYGNDFGEHAAHFRSNDVRRRLERQFDADVLSLLNPPEADRWEEHCIALRRERVLPQVGQYWKARSSMDLLPLLASLPLSASEREALAAPRRAYVDELNKALEQIEERYGEIFWRMLTNSTARLKPATARMQKQSEQAHRDWATLGRTIPDINERAVRTFAADLENENRERLMTAFNRAKYPILYVPTMVEWALDELQSPQCSAFLTAEQTDELGVLRNRYLQAQAELQQRTVVALDDWERPEQVTKRGQLRDRYVEEHGDSAPFDGDDPIAPLVQARYDLVKATASAVRTLLGDSLLNQAPLSVQIYLCPSDYFIDASQWQAAP